MREDPNQMHNVAADAAYADTKKKLSMRLVAVLEKTHDPRLTDVFDKPPYVVEKATTPGVKKPKQSKVGGEA